MESSPATAQEVPLDAPIDYELTDRIGVVLRKAFPADEGACWMQDHLRRVADEIIAIVRYEDCEHEWKGHKNPNTPDNPGEWIEFCAHCGAEKREED